MKKLNALFWVMGLLGLGMNSTSLAVEKHGMKYPEAVMVIDPLKSFLKTFTRDHRYVVDHVDSKGYELYGPKGLRSLLNHKHIRFSKMEGVKFADEYPNPEQIIEKMKELQRAHPKLMTLIEIGKSVEGRPLLFAKITAPSNVGTRLASRPEFKYVANMHGNEIVGREMMMSLIEDLVTQYGKDTRITKLVDSVQIYIMPSMNPDGAKKQSRFNSHGVDLNRSFPDFTTSDNRNTIEGREPEIQAMMKFQAQHQFKLSANFHGGAEVVNYPWDTSSDTIPQENLIKKLSLDYATRVPYIYNSTSFRHGITKGYDWYEVDGGMQDWSIYWHKDLQVTIELHKEKWPEYSVCARRYRENRDALLNYIEAVYQLN